MGLPSRSRDNQLRAAEACEAEEEKGQVMKLNKHDAIIHVWCEYSLGNSPCVCLLIEDGNRKPRVEYVQFDEFSPPLSTFLIASSFMSNAVTRMAIEALTPAKPRKGRDK
jgi:hypothetical protein